MKIGVRIDDATAERILAYYATGAYSMTEIGHMFDCSEMSVARCVRRALGWQDGDQRRLRKGKVVGVVPIICPHCDGVVRTRIKREPLVKRKTR